MFDDDGDDPVSPAMPGDAEAERREAVVRALRRYAVKLERKLDGLREDLAEAEGAGQWRRFGEALLAYARQVPARAGRVTPARSDASRRARSRSRWIPRWRAPANAARYFKRAAKAERGQRDIPPRIAAVEADRTRCARSWRRLPGAADDEAREIALLRAGARAVSNRHHGARAGEGAAAAFAPRPRAARPGAAPRGEGAHHRRERAAPRRPASCPPGCTPWRFRTREGWDVLIGRTSEGNDHLTLHVARPEDYWFHAHGCPGSHVVLRRGKGPNEPSKATLEEVAAWAAYHSKARTAGKVPVNYTQKKYVRKPRGAKAGLVTSSARRRCSCARSSRRASRCPTRRRRSRRARFTSDRPGPPYSVDRNSPGL